MIQFDNVRGRTFRTYEEFDRCNIEQCTFLVSCKFDRCNIIACSLYGDDVMTKCNVITQHDLEVQEAERLAMLAGQANQDSQ